jgi:hypothetical protein
MDRRKVLLLATAVLFVGWMSYLIHLALTHRHPTVLSRPQLLVSQLVVKAHIEGEEAPRDEARIEGVLYTAKDLKGAPKEGTTIRVANLPLCVKNWTGPGEYVLPLEREHDDVYVVTAIPRSPGFIGVGANAQPLIYRWSHEIEEQFKHIPKSEAAVEP